MSNIVIKAENLGKAYQLGQIGTGTISRDLERWYARVRGKEDPFLRIGEANDRSSKGTSDIVWSLKDIDFEIEQGDAVGIIGRNGAGKSTLLKILSKVTAPTIGKISGKGRIASLLEVGTGFHPELSGRENIFLNGAILGMRKKEIMRKFDEIVDFSGIERYIDTPVKRYSSGMYVRLAFAVAAHLESEILIVDEVLAVGDNEFQKKCLGKMGDVSKGEGRTVLFVSHNMGSILQLCNKGMFLKNGGLVDYGKIEHIVPLYISESENPLSTYENTAPTDDFSVSKIYLTNELDSKLFYHQNQINIHFEFNNYQNRPNNAMITAVVKNNLHQRLFATHQYLDQNLKNQLTLSIPKGLLLPKTYIIDILTHVPHVTYLEKIEDKLKLTIEDSVHIHTLFPAEDFGSINIPAEWHFS